MIYKATVQSGKHSYLDGQVIESSKIYKDEYDVWLLYQDSSEEHQWILVDKSTLEEIEVR
jgi:hypothetical protein